ncbi:TPA: hypothetical protein HA265_00930 [Candidatus Woesearchaeota archaeon]|nr:hypothetical protein [Candidatus Woesearchaeota archaeon]
MTLKLKCMNCGYKFMPKSRVPTKCPYCDRNSLRKDDTASSLISDVGREK